MRTPTLGQIAILLDKERESMHERCPAFAYADDLSQILYFLCRRLLPEQMPLVKCYWETSSDRNLLECAAAYQRGAELCVQAGTGSLPEGHLSLDPSDLLAHLECGPKFSPLDQEARAARRALWDTLPPESLRTSVFETLDLARIERQEFQRRFCLWFGYRDHMEEGTAPAFTQWLQTLMEPTEVVE